MVLWREWLPIVPWKRLSRFARLSIVNFFGAWRTWCCCIFPINSISSWPGQNTLVGFAPIFRTDAGKAVGRRCAECCAFCTSPHPRKVLTSVPGVVRVRWWCSCTYVSFPLILPYHRLFLMHGRIEGLILKWFVTACQFHILNGILVMAVAWEGTVCLLRSHSMIAKNFLRLFFTLLARLEREPMSFCTPVSAMAKARMSYRLLWHFLKVLKEIGSDWIHRIWIVLSVWTLTNC